MTQPTLQQAVCALAAVCDGAREEDNSGTRRKIARSNAPLEDRFWLKVDPSGECWLWLGYRNSKGYGMVGIGGTGKVDLAHRMSYRLVCGEIPPGLQVMHTCDNPPCVNPTHLRLGTNQDNQDDRVAKGRSKVFAVRGTAHHLSKLTEEKVAEARARSANGEPTRQLAREYGVTQKAMMNVVKRRTWTHVE